MTTSFGQPMEIMRHKNVDLMDGRTSDGVYLYNLPAYNNHLYFVATTEAEGFELWKSDGTTAGTALFADFELGPNGSLPTCSTKTITYYFYPAVKVVNFGSSIWQRRALSYLKYCDGPANGIHLNYRQYGAFTKAQMGFIISPRAQKMRSSCGVPMAHPMAQDFSRT